MSQLKDFKLSGTLNQFPFEGIGREPHQHTVLEMVYCDFPWVLISSICL